jgi:1-acyl-sn-glycerol-3-phosphate acyltransferase
MTTTNDGTGRRDLSRHLPRTWAQGPAAFVVNLLVTLLGGIRTEGLENLPRTGPAILVANHYTLMDPLVAGLGTCRRAGRTVHMVAKIQIKSWPLLGWLGSQAGVIYVRRGTSDLDAQRALQAVLAAGRPMVIFPEGTRSPSGALIPARNGAALLALRSGAPIVPLGITGTEGMLSWRAIFGPRPRAKVVIGQPFTLGHRPTGPVDRTELTEASNRLMREIAALLPPARRGAYG